MPLLFSLILGIIPGIVWLLFFLREDPKPEPARMIILAFLGGALFVLPAIFLEQLYALLFSAGPDSLLSEAHRAIVLFDGALIVLLLGLAAIEETLKFGAAFVVIHRSPYFDEAIDAMIYTIAAGLGFATAENVLFALNVFKEGLGAGLINSYLVGGVFELTTLRFVGATLLHGLGAAIIGYGWARGIIEGKEWHYILGGIAGATLLHTLFNYLIIMYGATQILLPTVILIIAAGIILYDFEKIRGYPRVSTKR